MKSKIILLLLGLILYIGTIQAEVAITLNVAKAGTLSSMINSSKKNLITSLTITGDLNGDDIRFIREMAGSDVYGKVTSGKLSVLDLSGANIVSGGSYYFYVNGSHRETSTNSISYSMFECCINLTSVAIPNSVTSINEFAFYGLKRLTSVTIPNSVTSIGSAAFYECKALTSAIIPSSVTSIEESAFNGCSGLTSLTIPNSVTSIGSFAFYGCNGLTSVTIPSSVTSLGERAFGECTGLTQIVVDSNNSICSSLDGVLFNKNRTLLITYPSGKSGRYSIPNSVTSIDESAFYGCRLLTSVTITSNVTSIGSFAFYSCNGLTSVTIPSSVTSIEESAFKGCSGLTEFHCQTKTPIIIRSNVFDYEIKSTCILYVPIGSFQSYWIASVWGDFANIIEEDITPINEISLKKTSVYTLDNEIIIQNAKNGETITVYTPLGALLRTVKVSDDYIKIEVPENQIYLVKIASNTYKVALN